MKPAQSEQPEPVAILRLSANAWDGELLVSKSSALPFGTKLYTAPPQREWQGLTQDERMSIINKLAGQDWVYVIDAIEAKLKEKNK